MRHATLTGGLFDTAFELDALRRPSSRATWSASGQAAVGEQLAWDPRSFKTASDRIDVTGASRLLSYDHLGRLQQSARMGAPIELTGGDGRPLDGASGLIHEGWSYGYDARQNLISRSRHEAGSSPEATLFDHDARNRPVRIVDDAQDVALGYDGGGNLGQKRDLSLEWDFRDRLHRATRADGTVVEYAYL